MEPEPRGTTDPMTARTKQQLHQLQLIYLCIDRQFLLLLQKLDRSSLVYILHKTTKHKTQFLVNYFHNNPDRGPVGPDGTPQSQELY